MAVAGDMTFLCEICGCAVEHGERAARISAEAGISDGNGGVTLDEEVVFAVFHVSCIAETRRQQSCDSVPYVEEAREVVDDGSASSRPQFVLYRGGLA